MKKWWIGCSGFSYRGWRERFYPKGLPQGKWFEYYCEFFNTVELNVTFYRVPKPETFAGWYARSPEEFRFTVKAPRLITHYKRFNDVRRETDDFYNIITAGLQDKLGTVLFQMPPKFAYTVENLDRILSTLNPVYSNVLEFRHPSWWDEKIMKVLKANNITFCSISYPGLPEDVYKTSPVMYYRFHGVPDLYLSSYTEAELGHVAHRINTFRSVEEVYAYFNNDIQVAAVGNAKALAGMVANF